MDSAEAGAAVHSGGRWQRWFIAAQFGIPAVLLGLRWLTGEIVWYGGGWQMFSG